MTLDIIVALSVHRIKRELISENINKSVSWRKFRIKKRKRQNNFIESVIHVYNRTLDDCALSWNESVQG